MKKRIAAGALMVAALGSATAATTITNADGILPFGGFDWASTASVWIDGYGALQGQAAGTTDNFDLYYQAYAIAIQDPNGANVATPGMKVTDTGVGYEYTINAVVHETVTCLVAGCTAVAISVNNGTWDVYYQAAGDAKLSGLSGGISGILNGTHILGGLFDNTSDTIVGAQGPSNPGNITLAGTFRGTLNFQDLAAVSPALTNTTAVSTLQFGTNVTAWNRPIQFDGLVIPAVNSNSSFVGQADANQAFAQVPEPGTLVLAGLALLSAGLVRRRKA